jgi:YHS domain-containing protein
MGIFSFLKKEKKLKCDWCGEEMEEPAYVKYIRNKKFVFCSESCKQKFRKSGKGKGVYHRCPTCAMAPKSWD